MATKLQEVILKRDTSFTIGIYYDVWCDPKVADQINAIPGVKILDWPTDRRPYALQFDPRYDSAELEAEILALGNM